MACAIFTSIYANRKCKPASIRINANQPFATDDTGVSHYSIRNTEFKQLRLAIEEKKGYFANKQGTVKSGGTQEKASSKKPATKRTKSVKARYGKRG